MAELAVAYVNIVPSARGIVGNLQRELEGPLVNAASQAGDKAAQAFGARFSQAGQRASALGDKMTLGLTVPLLAVGGAAIKASVDFESAFAGVRKTVDATEPELAALRQGILDMAQELPSTREEIAAVAEAAGALGIATPNILGFTRTMIDLGNATDLTADQAATALARIANVMGTAQTDFDRLGSALVDLGNNGASTEAEIVEMATRIAGAGKVVGLTEGEVLGFASALSSVGVEAEAGGTAISRVFVEVANAVAEGGSSLDEFARVAGVSTEAFRQSFEEDAAGAVITFIEGLGRIQGEGENVFATLEGLELQDVRLRNALLLAAGAGDLFRESIERGNTAWEENSALAEEANQRYATTESQLKIAANRASEVARQFGDALAPALLSVVQAAEPLVGFFGTMAEAFASLPGPVQTAIVAFGIFAAALGPIMSIGGRLATALGGMASGFKGLVGAMVGLNSTSLVAATGIGIVAGALIELQQRSSQGAAEVEEFTRMIAELGREGAAQAIFDQLIQGSELFRKAVDGNIVSFEEFKTAAAGGQEGLEGMVVALAKAAPELGVNSDEIEDTTEKLVSVGTAYGTAQSEIDLLSESLERSSGVAEQNSEAVAQSAVAWLQAAAAAHIAGQDASTSAVGFETWKTAIDGTKQAADNLILVLETLAGGQLGLDASVAALEQSYDEAGATLLRNIAAQEEAAAGSGELARTLDVTTDAGRSNRAALADIATAALGAASGFIEVHDDAAGAKLVLEQARDAFIRNATQMGITEEAANELADQYGLIPKNVDTAVKVVGADAAASAAGEVEGAVKRVPTDRHTTYSMDTGNVFSAVELIRNEIAKVPTVRTTRISVQRTLGGLFGHEGGVVPGPTGREVPITALGGEIIINPNRGTGQLQPLRAAPFGAAGAPTINDFRGAVIASDLELARRLNRAQRVGDRAGVRR